MNVLLLNGSPRNQGNTAVALRELEAIFHAEGIETETLHIGHLPIRGCVACNRCKETGRCVFDDIVNQTAPKLQACDGLIAAGPVYYASTNSTLISFLTRLFYSTPFDLTMKVGASVVTARRSGGTAALDELNKFFTWAGMPIASGQYWPILHGRDPGEAAQDAEGLQQLRTLARNMAFLMKSIALGKERYGLPQREPFIRTNFIR
jgi:multimeric flavodoxin WrbA